MQKNTKIIILFIVMLISVATYKMLNKPTESIIKIGALLPLTGDAAIYGEYTRNGMLVGIMQVNEMLKSQSISVQVIFEDSKANPRDGVSAARKLIDVDKVPVILDDSVSGVTLAVAPICDREKIVFLSTGATSPLLSGISEYFFRIWNSDLEEGKFSAEAAREKLDFERIAIIYINNEYGVGLKTVFADAFTSLGGEITAIEAFPQGATDFRAQLLNIRANAPQAIYLVAYPQEAKILFQQAHDLAVNTQWIGTVVMLEEEMPNLLAQFSYTMYFPAPAVVDESSSAFIEFRQRYHNMFNGAPPVLADVGYDSVMLIGSAIADGAKSGTDIKDMLKNMKPRDMASGRIEFDEQGDVHKPMVLTKLP